MLFRSVEDDKSAAFEALVSALEAWFNLFTVKD